MGQNQSAGGSDKDGILTDITDCIQFQVQKHRKILTQLNDLTYEDFQKCLSELNDLSRKCLDPADGKQLVFAVKKGTDSTILWKATTRIACVKVDPITRKIDNFKLINLKQFLQVFHTMTTNLEAINTYEEKQRSNSNSPSTTSQVPPNKLGASYVLKEIENTFNFNEAGTSDDSSEQSECCICLERKPEIILPCLHAYCAPCIEQWNTEHKSCPLCNERLKSTDDTWVIQEMPDNYEIHEEICSILMKLSNDDKKD